VSRIYSEDEQKTVRYGGPSNTQIITRTIYPVLMLRRAFRSIHHGLRPIRIRIVSSIGWPVILRPLLGVTHRRRLATGGVRRGRRIYALKRYRGRTSSIYLSVKLVCQSELCLPQAEDVCSEKGAKKRRPSVLGVWQEYPIKYRVFVSVPLRKGNRRNPTSRYS
jgi:hypothetical protein